MNTSRLRLIAGLLAASALMPAQSHLQLKIFTPSPEGYSVNSTLVYGDKDAILIDSQFLLSEAHRLAAMILQSRKNLTTVYITHPHPDHYFGLAVIKQAFPNAKLVALPMTVAGIKAGWGPRYKFWRATYGDNLPADPVIPEELQANTLMLGGETLEIVGGLTGDSPKNNSYVWIPSLKAVVAGAPTDASTIEFMKQYMQYFDQAAASSKSADELREKVKSRYPNLGLETLLNSSSQAAFPAAARDPLK